MLDEVEAMAMAQALASMTGNVNATAQGAGAAGGRLSEEVAAQWLVALENSGGDLAAAAAALENNAGYSDLAAAAAAAQAAQAQWGGGEHDFTHDFAPLHPPQGDPLDVAPPFNGDAAPSTSAAPGTVHYEESAVAVSAAQDALNRRYGGGLAPVGAVVAAGAGASSLVYSLWRDPSIGPYLIQTWGYLEGMLNPAGSGRP
jgi:hypothetical protein